MSPGRKCMLALNTAKTWEHKCAPQCGRASGSHDFISILSAEFVPVMMTQADGQVWTTTTASSAWFRRLHCDTRVKHTLPAKQLHFGEELSFKNYPLNGSLCKHLFLKNLEAIVSIGIISPVFSTVKSLLPWEFWFSMANHKGSGSVGVSIHDKRLLILKGSVVSLPWEPEGNAFKNSVPQTGR